MTDETPTRGMHALALIGVGFLISIAATVYVTPPASGYEVEIYASYPIQFWISVVGAIFVGQLLVLRSVGSRGDGGGRVFGIAFSLVGILTLLFLPYIRGYPVYGRADVLTHIGLVSDLGVYGIEGNIYPPMHILVASLAGATGVEPIALINLLSVVFTLLLVGSMYFLVTQLFSNRRVVTFALPFALFPVAGAAHVTSVPYGLSLLMVPFVVYLLFKEQRAQVMSLRVMLLFAIVGVVLFHPLTAMFVSIALVVYAAVKRIPAFETDHLGPTHAASFSLLVFGGWYLDNAGIIIRFRTVTTDFLNPDSGGSELASTAETVNRTGAELSDILRIAVFQYGSEVILFGLATIFVAIVITLWIRSGEAPGVFAFAFGCTVVLFAGIGVLFLTNDFIVGFGRPLGFGELFAAPLAGAFWYVAWQSKDAPAWRTATTVAFSAVLLIVVSLTVVGMFTSPLTAETNQQTTQMELDGMEWFFEHRNDDFLIEEFGIRQYRFDHALHGVEGESQMIRRSDTRPPDHFNYTTYDTLGESYADDRYLLLTRLGRVTYPAKFPDYRDQWRFTGDDFERLEYDRSVARVYDNGEFDIYRINGSETPPPE
jgi:hypothetical protein